MSNKYRQPYSNELMHYGIQGQKWGVRRYQNADGTYTDAGKKRYSKVQDDYPHLNEDSDRGTKEYAQFQSRVNKDVGDWYWDEWKSERVKEMAKERDELKQNVKPSAADYAKVSMYSRDIKAAAIKNAQRKIDKDFEEKLLGVVLEELGYEDTEAGREWIRYAVIYD